MSAMGFLLDLGTMSFSQFMSQRTFCSSILSCAENKTFPERGTLQAKSREPADDNGVIGTMDTTILTSGTKRKRTDTRITSQKGARSVEGSHSPWGDTPGGGGGAAVGSGHHPTTSSSRVFEPS